MEKKTTNTKTLLDIYNDDAKRLECRVGKDRSLNTLNVLKQGRGYVVNFLLEQKGIVDIQLDSLTPQFIHEFSVWLSATKGLRCGTVWLMCQQLKGVVARAYQRGEITWNPFAGFRIAKRIRPRQYLTEEELFKLIAHEFKCEKLRFARDIFVFSAFTGLSFIDIQKLKQSDLVVLGGVMWIISKRHKTNVPYQVRLLDIPLEILKRYQQPDREYVFGNMEYRTMAWRIKRVMEEVGFPKHITMHCGRHSFAVLAINKGMPIESISRILGHTNITTTQIYAKITMNKIDSDMVELEKKLSTQSHIGYVER